MATPLDSTLKRLPVRRRRAIEARAQALIAEAMPLGDLRKARRLTQAAMAAHLKIGQDSISRLEQRRDWRLSTLRAYVEGLGGTLHLVAHFPDREPVVLEAEKAASPPAKAKPRKRRAA